jgi:AraC-like DNA-binding protein
MQSNISIEARDRIVQAEGPLFRKLKKCSGYNYIIGNDNIITGHVKQLSFRDRIFIEHMDYRCCFPVTKQYHTQIPFIELICLDSAKALNRCNNSDEFSIDSGIHIYLNTGKTGELVFSSDIPLKGIRIIVFEEFYNRTLQQRFPCDVLNIDSLVQFNNQNHLRSNPALQLIFSQIRENIKSGIMSELYYENKITELLFLATAKNNKTIPSIQSDSRKLKNRDLLMVNKVQSIIDNNLLHTPNISELAKLSDISPAKLQNDFQIAFGCTIHDYVQKARMSDALQRIENTDDPLYQIARNIGLKNASRFAEVFKNTFGVLPSAYRNSHKR